VNAETVALPALNVLVVDDEPALRQIVAAALRKAGHGVDTAGSAADALGKLARGEIDVVITDVFMPVTDGIELIQLARKQGSSATFTVLTAFASVDSAIQAIKAGAHDYITKPVRNEELLLRLNQIAAMRGLCDENQALRNLVLGGTGRFHFASPAMQEIERLVTRVAPTMSTVLIGGESGTGKGMTARQIHELSPRREGPFIPVNCGAIPENLLESEFFGRTKGAFTSADKSRKGLFVQAHGGTIFLDEIGELPVGMQTKLLHVIEHKEVRPLGSEQVHRVDVRIIAATNQDLPRFVAEGRFREDLFFRLSVFQMRMPPLRERRADMRALIRFILAHHGARDGAAALTLDPEAEDILAHYSWPGNVRQLENVLHRAAILADNGRIRAADLPPEVTHSDSHMVAAAVSTAGGATLRERVRAFELRLIQQAIDECGGDRRVAAQRLGIGLSSLYRKLEDYAPETSPLA
jgi:two-component system, NtrC family, response regulator AtoC